MKKVGLFLLLMTTSAMANDLAMVAPVVPDEDAKFQALMHAFEVNGKSMVGWNAYDVTVPKTVPTEKITPVPFIPKNEKNELDKLADVTPAKDTCKRHGMRKVNHEGGWRCRK